MTSSAKRVFPGLLVLFLLPGVFLAQDVPLRDWDVPPYPSASSGGIHTMVDVAPPRLFIAVQPCRIADTRGNGAPIQGGIFANSEARTWDVTNVCGIPAGADALSVNFTVVSAPATPAGAFLLSWPAGQSPPPTAIMTYGPGVTVISNAAIVPLGTSEQLVVNVSHSTHIIMDVNGYFSDTLQTPQNFLVLTNNSTTLTAQFENLSTSCSSYCGIRVDVSSGDAIWGLANELTMDQNYGVYGQASSNNAFTTGVRGHADVAIANGGWFSNFGTSDVYIATEIDGIDYSLDGGNRVRAASLAISGAKTFIAPHPEDAGLEIRYASVEAPTVDVYFRGTGQLVNGFARIEVPDHFRFTAREGTYMTTLTPVGRAIPLMVEAEGADGIVVRGSGNTRFHYVVFAERAEIEGFQPVVRNESFTAGYLAKGNRVEQLPPKTRELLIRNGTLNPDGTFNAETARAQGWTIPARPSRPEPRSP